MVGTSKFLYYPSSLRHRWQLVLGVWRDAVGLDVLGLLLHPVARRSQVRQGALAAVLKGNIPGCIKQLNHIPIVPENRVISHFLTNSYLPSWIHFVIPTGFMGK